MSRMPNPETNPEGWLQHMIDNPPKGSVEVEVTPDMARAMLKRNTRNRAVSYGRVDSYADAMRKKQWMITGEPIVFASDGVLNDGQQRLLACIEAKVPFVTDVRFGVRNDAFRFTNTGKRRTPGDILSIVGEHDTAALASTLMYLTRWDEGVLQRSSDRATSRWRVEPDTILDTLRRNPRVRASVRVARTSYNHSRGFSPSILGFCHYIFSRIDSNAADAFFEQVSTGIGLSSKNSAAYLLRVRMSRYRDDRTDVLTAREQIGMVIKAWNAWRANKDVQRLGFRIGEPMPKPDHYEPDREPTPEEIQAAKEAAATRQPRRVIKHVATAKKKKRELEHFAEIEPEEEEVVHPRRGKKKQAGNGRGKAEESALPPTYGE